MGEQAGGARQDGNSLDGRGREAEVEQHRGDWHRDVHRERPGPDLGDGLPEVLRKREVRPAHAAGIRELENPFRARVERPMDRMAEPGHLPAGRVDRPRSVARDVGGRSTALHLLLCLLEQARALLGRAQYDGTSAENPRGDGSLQRSGICSEGNPSRDVGRHHPVLGDRDKQQVEEEPLLLVRLAAGEQQVEVLREAQPAHQIAGEVAPPHLDPVRIGLADLADRTSRHVGDASTRASDPRRGRRPAQDARDTANRRRALPLGG